VLSTYNPSRYRLWTELVVPAFENLKKLDLSKLEGDQRDWVEAFIRRGLPSGFTDKSSSDELATSIINLPTVGSMVLYGRYSTEQPLMGLTPETISNLKRSGLWRHFATGNLKRVLNYLRTNSRNSVATEAIELLAAQAQIMQSQGLSQFCGFTGSEREQILDKCSSILGESLFVSICKEKALNSATRGSVHTVGEASPTSRITAPEARKTPDLPQIK